MRRHLALVLAAVLAACGGDDGSNPNTCDPPAPFVIGDANGHAQPLGAGPTEARAGRLQAADLPAVPSGLVTWKAGDFVLANDRVALVIEDAGDSDLYDPWGGRPVGMARVAGGRMIEPANFGEVFLLTGRASIVTEDVSVLADGSMGGPAIIRTVGTLHPVPFFDAVTMGVFQDLTGVRAAIDYELAPGSNRIDVRYRYLSDVDRQLETGGILHALMYTKRTPVFVPARGFTDQIGGTPYVGLVDDDATSWAYVPADVIGSALSVSGFVGGIAAGFRLPACAAFDRVHAQIVIGGPGLDGLVTALADDRGTALRTITGTVTRGAAPAPGVHVHAVDAATDDYYTRTTTAADGSYTLHVPTGASARVVAVAEAAQVGAVVVDAATGTGDVALPAPALVTVHVSDGNRRMPGRVQILPAASQEMPNIPANYGEDRFAGDRLRVAFTISGDVTIPVPPGSWELVVSHGFEYDVVRRPLTVTAGQTVDVLAELPLEVDTSATMCGDFHIHTARSNDSGDDAELKVASAIADGLELPVRSEHEYVADFAAEIAALGAQRWAAGFGSIEMTSFETWGHMGVFPLVPDPTKVNAGAPTWQTFPTADRPDEPFATLSPVAVFDAARARPEAPVVIINHPRGSTNYFGYVGYDAATGIATATADWDTQFTLVEVFNDSSWQSNFDGTVRDWMGLLKAGRKIFAVGSSDSHSIAGSPVGYPRTCLALGTDDPRQVTANQVRDTLAAGHGTVSGGIYVTASVGAARPGDTASGLGMTADVDVVIQAASWIDVDAIDVMVDGARVDTIPIMPGDADPTNPAVRWRGAIPIDVRADGSGFVVIAAYGDATLEPVHPGRTPFGVSNPIFVKP
ncbi:MAG: CehA/McbA family metallohydrolase [Myxococcales bacterium]|nr:CehA/McbA family metallohydrolase [Myxococcales bacterium]